MSMKIRRYGIATSLLFLAFLMRSDVYGRLTESLVTNVPRQSEREHWSGKTSVPSAQSNDIYGRLTKLLSLVLEQSKTPPPKIHTSVQPATRYSDEFGREHPFMPLTVTHKPKSVTGVALTVEKTAQPKPEPEPSIRLTTVFAATGSHGGKTTAIIEENGINRSISIGDTVAGMTVAEIKRGEVILSKGDKKCVMKLGVLFKKTAEEL